jgi:molybdate transport system substrate-binding protein
MRAQAIAVALGLAVAGTPAGAAEVKAMITTAMKAAVDELLPPFERASGNKVIVSYDPSGRLGKRLRDGEFADIILLASDPLDKLIAEGKVRDRTEISRTGIALAVKKGAPHPDVSTPDALKRTLLAAKSIGFAGPASGGATAAPIMAAFDKLGIATEIAAKTKYAAGGPNGRVSVLVANGEVEIGLQQVAELMSNPDVEVIGMLPDSLQKLTVHAAGVTAIAKQPDAAHALIRHLVTPQALAIYKAKGLGL